MPPSYPDRGHLVFLKAITEQTLPIAIKGRIVHVEVSVSLGLCRHECVLPYCISET
ncbi:hypothetical protein KM92DES2_10439 [uncultured Desulfovibrio sp.]|uniref:Uncharacterized protein n=1 Tax=uncultured Desulfovibrio sp. TaxID=167968 RepID=A0A212J2Q8_9BACT|nr:hypothetical protein KM92DES2_10439 [uncultured Desulfovibrio sp.]